MDISSSNIEDTVIDGSIELQDSVPADTEEGDNFISEELVKSKQINS